MSDAVPSARADVARTFVNRLAVVVMSAAISVLLARALGPDGRGQYAVAIAFATTCMAIGHLSLEQAIVGAWVDPQRRTAIAGAALQVGIVVAPLTVILSTLAVPIVVDSADIPLARLATLAIIPMMLVVYLNALAVADGDIQLVNRSRLGAALLQLALTVLVVVTSIVSVRSVVWVWITISAAHLLSLWKGHRWRSVPHWPQSRTLVAVGLRYHTGIVATYLLRRVDILILNRYEEAFAVGLYALAVTIAELLYLMTDSIAQVTQPSQLATSSTYATRRTAQLVRITVIVGAATGTCAMFVAWLVVPTVYGSEFKGAVPAVVILAPGVVALATVKPISVLLLRHERPWILTGVNVGVLVLNVGGNIVLIPSLGLVGAAIASTLAYTVQALLHGVVAQRLSRLRMRDLVPTYRDVRTIVRARR